MKKAIVLGISVLIFGSCNNSGTTTTSEDAVTHTEDAGTHTEAHAEHHYNESSGALELNNGERWVVNEEMKPFVAEGSHLVDTYVQENQTNYTELAQQVKDQNNKLIESCTMEGKSHDELHKWLSPHMTLVQDLENSSNEDEARNIVQQLQESYKTYHNYFI